MNSKERLEILMELYKSGKIDGAIMGSATDQLTSDDSKRMFDLYNNGQMKEEGLINYLTVSYGPKEEKQSRLKPPVIDENASEEEYNRAWDQYLNTKASIEKYEQYQNAEPVQIDGVQKRKIEAEQIEKKAATKERLDNYEKASYEKELQKAAEQERERKFNELSQNTELGHKNIRRLSDEGQDEAIRKYILKENDDISVETTVEDNENSAEKGFNALTEQEIVTLQATVDPEALSENQKKAIREELGLAADAEITRENLLDAKDDLFSLHYDYEANRQDSQDENLNGNDNRSSDQTPGADDSSNDDTTPEDEETEEIAKGMLIKEKGKEIVSKIKNKVMNIDTEKAMKVLIVVAAGAAVIVSGGSALGLAPMASLTTAGVGAAGGYAANEFNKGRKGK